MDENHSSPGDWEREAARLREENESLRAQLADSQETLRAIREGEVDALVVSTPEGERVFTLQGGDHPYRALIEQMREGAVTLTPQGVIHYCNRRCAEMLRLPLEVVMGSRMEDFVAAADRSLLATMLGEGGGRAELTLTAADATEVPALVSAIRLQTEGPVATCLVVSDLTERKRHEAEIHQLNAELESRVVERTAQLAAARDLLAVTLASIGDAVIVTDAQGRVTFLNGEAERLTGWTSGAAQGRRLVEVFKIINEHTHQPVEDPAEKVLRKGTVVGLANHTILLAKDGRETPIDDSGAPIRQSDGAVQGVVLVFRDITENKRAEEMLKAAKDSAEQAKAAAEQANRAKDHFLAVLSHELRTPLTPVVMGISMLQDRADLDSPIRETLEMVRRNVEMEARLIDDLLDVSRIARGKVELARSAVQLGAIIHRAVEVCKPDIEERGLHFGVDLGPAGPYWIEADVSRLQQVFWNLLKNAIKFTPRGGYVGIRCWPSEQHVVAEVNDSGLGIEPEALSRIFNTFEQAERSITQQFGGLGLGLAISKALVEMHGGQIEAHSEGRGRGATFRVRLPLTAPPGQLDAGEPAAPGQRAVRPLRVLLVEDHGVTAKLMRMVLTSDGHAVETAGDVATAMELADQHPFDLLVSDLGLPDGSGHDLMRKLRQRGHTFPAIALSGYGQGEDIQRSREAGFAAHLTKPASRAAVLEAVASVTDVERPG